MPYYFLLLPSLIIFYTVFFNICKCKFSIAELTLSAIISYLVVMMAIFIFSHIAPNIGVDIPGNMALAGSLFAFSYRKFKNFLLSGYYVFLTVVATMLGGTAAGILVNYIFASTVADVRSDLVLFLITVIPAFVINYTISKYIGNYLHQCYTQLSSTIKKKFAAYGFILSSLTYLLTLVNLFVYQVINDRTLLYAVDVLLILFIFFVAMFMMMGYSLSLQKQSDALLKSQAEKDLESYNKQLELAYNNMRTFRHDYRNLLSTLIGYDTLDSLKSNLSKHLGYAEEALQNLDTVMGRLNLINIPELKGLLRVKCAQAQAQGISVEINIAEPIYEVSLNYEDLCRLVGIVIDNAIDELMMHDYNPKVLNLSITSDEGDLIIDCTNPCKTAPLLRKMFDEGYSTKGVGRGLGLPNLKRICDDNKNISYTIRIENGEFAFIIIIEKV